MAEVELRAQFVDQASPGIDKLAKNLQGLAAGYGIEKAFEAVFASITEAQEATIELDRLFKSFGDTVGVTKQNMLDYATTIQNTTTLSDEAVLKGQASLLKYTSITGAEFERVRAIAVDVAATMGGDVAGAADQLGRALENPLQGMRILRGLGIVLSPEQQALAKNMVETGRAAQVQGFLLAELEKRYKGAAEAAATTLGGALEQLKNRFTDAFEGQGADVNGLVASIHELADTLSSEQIRSGIATLVEGMVKFVEWIAKAVSYSVTLAKNLGEAAAKFVTGVSDNRVEQIRQEIGIRETRIKGGRYTKAQDDGDRAAIAVLTKELNDAINDAVGGEVSSDRKRIAAGSTGTKTTGGLSGPILATAKEQAEAAKKALAELTQQTKEFLALIGSADKNTQSQQDKIDKANDQFLEDIKFLLDSNAITREEANRRVANYLQDDLDKAQQGTAGRRQTFPKEEVTEYQRLARDAAKSITQAFSDMFENMGNGANGFLRSILGVFRKIVAEAAALDLAKLLGIDKFGQGGGGGGGSNLGGILKTVAGFFGFAGGTSQLNGPAIVGENGPELFVPPGFGGSIVPNYAMGGMGGINYSPITNIQASEGTDMNKLKAILAINNDQQRAELMRMFERNGFGRLR